MVANHGKVKKKKTRFIKTQEIAGYNIETIEKKSLSHNLTTYIAGILSILLSTLLVFNIIQGTNVNTLDKYSENALYKSNESNGIQYSFDKN